MGSGALVSSGAVPLAIPRIRIEVHTTLEESQTVSLLGDVRVPPSVVGRARAWPRLPVPVTAQVGVAASLPTPREIPPRAPATGPLVPASEDAGATEAVGAIVLPEAVPRAGGIPILGAHTSVDAGGAIAITDIQTDGDAPSEAPSLGERTRVHVLRETATGVRDALQVRDGGGAGPACRVRGVVVEVRPPSVSTSIASMSEARVTADEVVRAPTVLMADGVVADAADETGLGLEVLATPLPPTCTSAAPIEGAIPIPTEEGPEVLDTISATLLIQGLIVLTMAAPRGLVVAHTAVLRQVATMLDVEAGVMQGGEADRACVEVPAFGTKG